MITSHEEAGNLLALRQALIDELKRRHCLSLPQVEAAFRAIPRHLFLPDLAPGEVYRDEAIPTKLHNGHVVSSSSQPAIMAIMLEQLDVRPGDRVLEIGAGTGYNAALLDQLVGAGGQVVTVDLDEDTAEHARAHLAAAGAGRVRVVCGDGGLGWAEGAPYDRIILTVGAWDIAPAWREQLRAGGRLVLPLSLGGPQKAVAFEHAGDHLVSVSVCDCGFMRLRGAFAGPETCIPLGPEPGLYLDLEDSRPVDAESVYAALTGPFTDLATGITVTPGELWGGLGLWLALHEPELCNLRAERELAERDIVPYLFEFHGAKWRTCFTTGVLHGASLCALLRQPGRPATDEERPQPFEPAVRYFGPDQAPARHLLGHLKAWDAAGRPDSKGLRVRVYPNPAAYAPTAAEIMLPKRWNRLVLDWP